PQGGLNRQTFQDSGAVWHNTFIAQYFKRPQHQLLANVNYFLTTGPLGHEFKVGGSFRNTAVGSVGIWPGGLIAFQKGSGACSVDCGAITRQSNSRTAVTYYSAYASDTLTMDRLTASIGLRYDDQKGTVQAASVPENALFPNILPAASAAQRSGVVHWQDVSPRVGLTYAVGASRKTLARLSYARYANQLGAGSPVSPLSAIPGVAYAYYPWNDANSNRLIDAGELDTSGTAIRTINFNPANPSAPVSVHRIDPNLKSQKTDEVVAGVGHELLPNFAVDVAYTYRHSKDYWFSHRIGLTDADYHLDHTVTGTLPDGTPYSAPIYSINGGRAAVPSGFIAENRPNYSQDFNGAELTLNKRLSSGWLMRGSFAYNDSKQKVGRGACVDPTNGISGTFTAFGGEDSVPGICADGGLVAPNAGGGSGSFGNVNLQSKWQFNVSGAYQLPLGFTVAGNFYGRQGYPIAYYVIDATSADGISRRAYATKVDADRYGWAHQLDLRVDKAIPITSTITASLAVDFFNVLNDITITQRNSRLLQASKTTGTNTIFETQSPRILRFSGRISF
ncbi:MAG: hypothetical protein LC780_05465, partial [Acidobacteria bacterium]|nr:hypothetical protein [Acidobacteriota bacterium]